MSRIDEIRARMEKACPGPWKLRCFESGTIYIHMRNAMEQGLTNPDGTSANGALGAHMTLRNLAAFTVGAGEDEIEVQRQKHSSGEFVAHSREDVEYLLEKIDKLQGALRKARSYVLEYKCDNVNDPEIVVIDEALE